MPALPEIVRDLIAVTTPISFEVDDEAADVTIKGFASVESIDRSGDVVPPEEFNIKQFMAAPAIMVNHKFWIDSQGNEVTVGRPLSLDVVKLAEGDEENWNIVNEDGEVINTFPKNKVPNLNEGDRGLFIVAKVTEETLVDRVRRGEFSAFSWRGLASVDFRVNKEHDLERVLTDIDLFEISLVNVPDNPNATFTVGKSAHIIKLSKGKFDKPQMFNYLKEHKLSAEQVMEDKDSYYSRQLDSEYFDLEKLVLMKMADGVHIIAGDAKIEVQSLAPEENDTESNAWPWSWLSKDTVEKFTSSKVTLLKESEMAEDTKVVEDEKKEEEKAVEEEKTEEEKDANVEAMAEFQEAIAAKTAEAMTPLFESLTASNQAIVEILTKAFEKKEEKKEEEKEEEQKSNAAWDKLNTMAETLTNLQSQLVEVAKSAQDAEERAEALAKSTADETEREEKVEAKKTNDPNHVFDSVFPFLSR